MAVNIEGSTAHIRMVSDDDFATDSENNSPTVEYASNNYYKFYNMENHGNSSETVVKMPATLSEAHELIAQLDTQVYSLMNKTDNDSEIIENNNKYLIMKENEHMHKEKEYLLSYQNFLDKIKSYEDIISKLKKSNNENKYLHEKLDKNSIESEHHRNQYNELKEFIKTRVIDMLTAFKSILKELSTKWTENELKELFSKNQFESILKPFLDEFLYSFVEGDNTSYKSKLTIDSEVQTSASQTDSNKDLERNELIQRISQAEKYSANHYKSEETDYRSTETNGNHEAYKENDLNKSNESSDKNNNSDSTPSLEDFYDKTLEDLYIDDYVVLVSAEDLTEYDIVSFDDHNTDFNGLDSIVIYEKTERKRKKDPSKTKVPSKNKKSPPSSTTSGKSLSTKKKSIKTNTTKTEISTQINNPNESNDSKTTSSSKKMNPETFLYTSSLNNINANNSYTAPSELLQPRSTKTEPHPKTVGQNIWVKNKSVASKMSQSMNNMPTNRFKTSADHDRRAPSVLPVDKVPSEYNPHLHIRPTVPQNIIKGNYIQPNNPNESYRHHDNPYHNNWNSKIEKSSNQTRLPPPPPKALFKFISQNHNQNTKFTPVNLSNNPSTLKMGNGAPMQGSNNDFYWKSHQPQLMQPNVFQPRDPKFKTPIPI